ncbi:MAG: S41 family peptidase, partial [Bacteroidota bacterium]
MRDTHRRWVPVLAACGWLLAAPVLSGSTPPATPDPDPAARLEAFARAYGAVRFFHPSDEAAAADWDRVARLGAERVLAATTPGDLERAIESVLRPLAPSVDVFSTDDPPDPLVPPADADRLTVVAWQHAGVWLDGPPNVYRSVRLGRPSPMQVTGPPFGGVIQALDATPFRGRRVRLSADIRVESGQAQLWVRADRPGGQPGFFQNLPNGPVTSTTWDTYAVEGTVDDDADMLAFGGLVLRPGTAWLDAFRLDVEGAAGWEPVALPNASFEAADRPEGWGGAGPGYTLDVRPEASDGDRALRVSFPSPDDPAAPLFDARVSPEETAIIEIGQGLSVSVPLALYSRDGQTRPRPDGAELDALDAALAGLPEADAGSPSLALRAADVIVAWSTFHHFYPYLDDVEVDLDAALTEALEGALQASTPADHCDVLRQLVSRLEDGHGNVRCAGVERGFDLPFSVEMAEGQIVVVATADSAQVQRGDVVVSIDGEAAKALVEAEATLMSGSPQWRTHRALRTFGRGNAGSTARVGLDRERRRMEVDVARVERAPAEQRPAPISEVRPGILYVDIDRTNDSLFTARLGDLVDARGVVLDFRGYPRQMSTTFLNHLVDEPVVSAWLETLRTVRPGQPGGAGVDSVRWEHVRPMEPHIGGRLVFLTDARAISYAESILGIVDHFDVGTTVGGTTAGANGNVNPLALPGGHQVAWTGMRVRRHDGRVLHAVGIEPMVEVRRTLAGIRAGRDEVLERGIAIA